MVAYAATKIFVTLSIIHLSWRCFMILFMSWSEVYFDPNNYFELCMDLYYFKLFLCNLDCK